MVLPEHRGRGYGSAGQRARARELLGSSDANRVEADTDVENGAERRALEKAGFVQEGIARQAQWRQGGWHDMVLYGLVRADLDTGSGGLGDSSGLRRTSAPHEGV